MSTLQRTTATALAAPPEARALDERASVGRRSVLSFAGAATSAVLGFLVVVVLARGFGEAASGIVLQAIAVFMIALGFARFGMDSTAVWLLPRLVDDAPQQVRSTAWFLIGVSGVIGTVCAVIVFVGATLVAGGRPDPLTAAVRWSALFLPFASMLLTALAVSRALGRLAEYVWIGSVGLPLARLVAVLAAVALGFGTGGTALVWAAPAAVALVIALGAVGTQLRQGQPPGADRERFFGTRLPARTLGFAGPRVISAALEQMLLWVSVLVVGGLAGPAAAGVYGAASRFIAAGLIVDSAIRVVVAPMFSRLQHRDQTREIGELHRTATSWLVLFSAPVFLLLAVFAPVALSVLGPGFAGGSSVLAVMCLGALVAFLAGNVQTVLLTAGRSGLAAMNKAIVVALNIALIPLFMGGWGLAGAAWAWTAACIADALLAWCEIRWVLHLRIAPAAGVRALIVCLVCVGAPALAARVVLGTTWTALAVAVVTGGALFAIACRAQRSHLRLPGRIETPG